MQEAAIVIEHWRQFYNDERPHSALNYLPPAAFAAHQARLQNDTIVSLS
jgi:putative transposase